MRYLFLAAEVFLFLLSVKAILFWAHLWQLKEYRLDRFWAEYGSFWKIIRFWIGAGGRRFYRPKFTLRAVLIFLSALLFICIVFLPSLLYLLPIIPAIPAVFYLEFLKFSLGMYFIIPLLVFLFTVISKLPVFLLKELLYARAEGKREDMKNLTVVGIAGSYGKSSTKEFLAQLLSEKVEVLKTPENVNSEAGVARFVLNNLKPEHDILVAEIGAYRRGEIKKVCKFLRPAVGVLTGISEQHMALFGSLEKIKQAKYELIESLPRDGFAAFNGENVGSKELFEKWKGRKVLYHLSDLRPDLPRHYRINLQGAVEVAKYLGMNDEEIRDAVGKIHLGERMTKTFTGKSGTLVIDDSYSENPDGVMAALDMLAATGRAKKTVVMPCIIELGKSSGWVHQKIGKKIKEIDAEAIVTTRDNFDDIRSNALDAAICAPDISVIKQALKAKLGPEAAVLLEGRLPDEILKYDF